MLCKIGGAICLVLALETGASAQNAPSNDAGTATPESRPVATADTMDPPIVGDHWTYETRDEIAGTTLNTSTNVVTDLSPTEISVRAEWLGKPGFGYFTYDHSWNLKNGPVFKSSPNDGTGVKLPLNVGSTWKFQGNDVDTTHGVVFKRSGSSKVIAQENITTAAGTFDTFKIETAVDVRNANDPTKKGQQIMTTWYAPSVDHWVKRTVKASSNGHIDQDISSELVEYGRR
jgi:hypothetical protein